jgi:hypothetical protein
MFFDLLNFSNHVSNQFISLSMSPWELFLSSSLFTVANTLVSSAKSLIMFSNVIKSQTPDSFRIRYRTWFIRWNKSKCKHMHLEPETDYNYMIEENVIANTMEEKDLGIIIDNKLNFQNHINKPKSLIMFSNASGRSFMYMVNSMGLTHFPVAYR